MGESDSWRFYMLVGQAANDDSCKHAMKAGLDNRIGIETSMSS
jgi:hypothetical protein